MPFYVIACRNIGIDSTRVYFFIKNLNDIVLFDTSSRRRFPFFSIEIEENIKGKIKAYQYNDQIVSSPL